MCNGVRRAGAPRGARRGRARVRVQVLGLQLQLDRLPGEVDRRDLQRHHAVAQAASVRVTELDRAILSLLSFSALSFLTSVVWCGKDAGYIVKNTAD